MSRRKLINHQLKKVKDPLNPDGSLTFFWYDAHFDEFANDGIVYMFGKC